MKKEHTFTLLIVGAVLFWLIFGYSGSITVPQNEVKATYKPTVPVTRPQVADPVGAVDDNFDGAYVDTLPDPAQVKPLDDSNPLEPPRFTDGA